jgi:hypothetical protein
VHEAASDSLARRLAGAGSPHGGPRVRRPVPRQGDGTRRTADALYDGGVVDGDYTYGIGGYLRDADN